MSKSMRDQVYRSVRHLTSETSIQTPLNLRFPNLETADDQIVFVLNNTNQIPPLLRQANLYIGRFANLNDFGNAVLLVYNIIKTRPNIKFKIIGTVGGRKVMVIFDQNKFMTLFEYNPYDNSPKTIIHNLLKNNPSLKFYAKDGGIVAILDQQFQTRIIGNKNVTPQFNVMLSNLREFLYQADFGLIDLNLPPSSTNLSLNNLARRLSNQGFALPYIISILLRIHVYSHTGRFVGKIPMTDLLRNKFGYLFPGRNTIYLGAGGITICNSGTVPDDVWTIVNNSIITTNTIIDVTRLYLYEIPPGPSLTYQANNNIESMIVTAYHNRHR